MANYFSYYAFLVVIVMFTIASVGKLKKKILTFSFIVILYSKADYMHYFVCTTTRI